MKDLLLCIVLTLLISSYGHAQLNVELLHQLVQHSKDENERQTTSRNRQAITSANEEVNYSKMDELKQKYRKLQNRFHALGLAIDASQIALQAAPLIAEIIENQDKIIGLASADPILIAMAYQTEIDIAEKTYMLSRYLYALAISLGDLNQMKASDRKLLFGHVITELGLIAGVCRGLAVNMFYSSRKKMLSSMNPFASFINRDRQLVNDILAKLKQIKK
ncbi:hypothetical protein BWD42_06945 [Sphingobacterium sp. CZ-UAM]|uniref:hypothetical protein n=1 Tax=Sphingobacterium sp. CZ-UAM TaxID=1933868 RepID=UPI00098503CA|nr:hypothetical protein [Sphingobacterium sp. CZ-UAM]OOG19642.1 hypothetical protein BWD42_06945 [Sphingobacterium sp. CZ-UAM]